PSHPLPPLFPYTTLFRSTTAMQRILQRASQACGWSCFLGQAEEDAIGCLLVEDRPWDTDILSVRTKNLTLLVSASDRHLRREIGDRKSTRLNSSHVAISY